MSREKFLEEIINNDIENIRIGLEYDDTEYLYNLLKHEYNHYTDEEISQEYIERFEV